MFGNIFCIALQRKILLVGAVSDLISTLGPDKRLFVAYDHFFGIFRISVK